MIPAAMSWYYSKNGTQLGPVAEEELSAKIKSGEVAASDLVWKEGMPDWKSSGQVPEFQTSVVAPPQMPQSPGNSMGSVPMTQPPPAPVGFQQARPVPNYLWQSIAATVLCCLPFGVVGIVYAAKVDGMVASGDTAGAIAASKAAKMWTNISVISWVAIVGIGFVASVLSEA